MHILSYSETMLVSGGFVEPNQFGDGRPNRDRRDRDGDGDYDFFDREITLAEELGVPLTAEERSDLAIANALHEFAEDVNELFDDNPNNDSFFDGANGSGNETPSPAPSPR